MLSDSGYCLQTFRFFSDRPEVVKVRLEKDELFLSEVPMPGKTVKICPNLHQCLGPERASKI